MYFPETKLAKLETFGKLMEELVFEITIFNIIELEGTMELISRDRNR